MTIICVKDGVIAADGSGWQGDVLIQTDCRKIVRSADGAIGAACGCACDDDIFIRWFATTDSREVRGVVRLKDDPLIFDKDSGFKVVWLEQDGETWMMDYDGKPYAVGHQPQAIGGAWQTGLGAMLGGASAEEAVHICVARHSSAGGEVFVERLAPVEALPEDIDARPVETFGTDRVAEPVNERRAAMAEWKERVGLV